MPALQIGTYDDFRTQLINPPRKPLGLVKGLWTITRNPVEWWPAQIYEDGIMANRSFGRVFIGVARPDYAKAVLLDEADAFGRSHLANRILKPAMGEGLLTSDGEQWRAQRRMAAPLFRQQALDGFLPTMDKAAQAARQRLEAHIGTTTDILPEMIATTFDIIIETLFGDITIDRKAVAQDMEDYIRFIGQADLFDIFNLPEFLPRPWKNRGTFAVRNLITMSRKVLDETRRSGKADSLTAQMGLAIDPETGASMSDERIIDNILTFIGAGHETTSVALTWTLYLLAQQPNLQNALAQEARAVLDDGEVTPDAHARLELMTRVLQESMRLYPPIAAVSRTAVREAVIGGELLKPGDHVTVAILPMHRNASLWPDPHRFDVGRFLPDAIKARDRFAYLPFGAGPRICIGWKFAMMEAVVILARLVSACRFLPAEAPPPRPVLRISLRPENGMPLRIERRR